MWTDNSRHLRSGRSYGTSIGGFLRRDRENPLPSLDDHHTPDLFCLLSYNMKEKSTTVDGQANARYSRRSTAGQEQNTIRNLAGFDPPIHGSLALRRRHPLWSHS